MCVAVAIIAVATLTPDPGFLTARPARWCLTCSPTWLADAISNVVLFVPLALSLRLRGFRAWQVVALGALLSLAIELLQAVGLPTGRTPALADWISNSIGVALGAIVGSHHALLLRPGRRVAQRLLVGWTLLTAFATAGSWWALSPATSSVGASTPVALSPLPFTPGHGWYVPLADSATVNGVPIPHGGNGPIIAEARRTDTVRVRVRVRGFDDRRGVVPIVFVHAPKDTIAHLLLAQRGDDVVVGTWLNARQAGLFTPMLALRGVFASDHRADTIPLWLEATVSGRTLQLAAHDVRGQYDGRLALSPLLGWALLQQVVRADSPLSSLMTMFWVLFWVGPLVYWSLRASVLPLRRS